MLSLGVASLRRAHAAGRAIGAFATYDLEQVQAVTKAAEITGAPVMLLAGSSQFRHADIRLLATAALVAAEEAEGEVGVHLDHSRDLAELRRCVEFGYTSVMYDGSHEPYEDNVAHTAEAVRIAHGHGAWVEGELCGLAGDEDVSTDVAPTGAMMTSPEQAADFVDRTGVDALAVSVGNVHGFSSSARLDLDRLDAVRKAVPVPLVLHGASGLPANDLDGAIRTGVAKINVNAELRRAYLEAVADVLPAALPGSELARVLRAGREAVRDHVVTAIRGFGWS
ncbi:class II fructose-bisphosphate aldolase [Saccharopolyspora mangrovi]|uniref:Class II fructose-bisphosphate aldolase n=1 Tax=Saccharopolyspora mangrovi TaxID=3082379 RepID=A0ABU6AKB3_9PSEU|nr:class II fructose-bisphosphate aldolase [Saccharopolyspora sp. S2-29]MEB3371897.1 class II fructose-bisphosphate aldolase [Saccharopolyspora sp. S2-29]